METFSLVATAAGLGWASGLRLYAVIFALGLLHYLGLTTLPPDLAVAAHPAVMTASGVMLVVEFGADKVPGLDSLWDAIHTFVRIPGGALLAAGALAGQSTELAFAAAILGGTLAAGSHFAKAGSRALINTSPEPFSNWTASFTEDIAAMGAVWFALWHPWLTAALLLIFVVLLVWLLPRLLRGIKHIATRIRVLFD